MTSEKTGGEETNLGRNDRNSKQVRQVVNGVSKHCCEQALILFNSRGKEKKVKEIYKE